MICKFISSDGNVIVDLLQSADQAALKRFAECCEDSDAGGHDVPQATMRRLSELGVVRHVGAGRYETTSFGDRCLGEGNKRSPTPLMTLEESNNASQLAGEASRALSTKSPSEAINYANMLVSAMMDSVTDKADAEKDMFLANYRARHNIPADFPTEFIWKAERTEMEYDGWVAGRAAMLRSSVSLTIPGENKAADEFASRNPHTDRHEVSVESFCAGVGFACKMLPTLPSVPGRTT